ncbi:hypothetical protein D3Z52_19340 [Clostridiaceae bacterium]|nr:hypothetical protein [Clostridiaceae bacterium]
MKNGGMAGRLSLGRPAFRKGDRRHRLRVRGCPAQPAMPQREGHARRVKHHTKCEILSTAPRFPGSVPGYCNPGRNLISCIQ